MSQGFEIYRPDEHRDRPRRYSVTITRAGQIGLNRVAYEALSRPQFVQLLYDRGRRAFALRPAANGQEDACKVFRLQSGGGVINARVFTRFCGFEDGELYRLEDVGIEDGALVATMPGAGRERSPMAAARAGADLATRDARTPRAWQRRAQVSPPRTRRRSQASRVAQ